MKIDKTEDGVMLFLFFIVAITNGVLTAELESQKNKMIEKDRRISALYNLLKGLSGAKHLNALLTKVVEEIQNTFGFESVILFPGNGDKLKREPFASNNFIVDEIEWLSAEAAFKTRRETGKSTGTMHTSKAIYIPVIFNDSVLCVIGVKINDKIKSNKREMEFLRNFLNEITQFIKKFMNN